MRSCDIWTRLLLHNSVGGAHVIVQPHGSGGFGVVSVQFKVWALHVQWVRRFGTSFLCWMQFLFYYFRKAFGTLPRVVLSRRYLYDLSSLPPFYRGLLSAWVAAEGSFSATRESLVVGSFSCESPIAVAEDTTKSLYSLLVANHFQLCSSFRHCFGSCTSILHGTSCFGSLSTALWLIWHGWSRMESDSARPIVWWLPLAW